jgi:hypothetical protein
MVSSGCWGSSIFNPPPLPIPGHQVSEELVAEKMRCRAV